MRKEEWEILEDRKRCETVIWENGIINRLGKHDTQSALRFT